MNLQTILAELNDLPVYVVAPAFTFLGVLATLFLGPRVQWGIEKKRELRQHRRQLVAQWRAMVADVNRELDRLEKIRGGYDPDHVLRALERHASYPSFTSAQDQYSRSGMRGIKLQFVRSWFRRKLYPVWKPRIEPSPEDTVMFGSHLPARLHTTIRQIAEIERWWHLQ